MGTSPLYQTHFGPSVAGVVLSPAVEAVIGDASPSLGSVSNNNTSLPWNFPQLGATRMRIGVTGEFGAATNPITLRVRVGGTTFVGNNEALVATDGVARVSQVIPVGGAVVYDLISAEFDVPLVSSYVQLTAESPVGAATLSVGNGGYTVWALPINGKQAILLATSTSKGGGQFNGPENIVGEWEVDYDVFDASVTNVALALATRASASISTFTVRVRQGGTAGAVDGTILLSNTAATSTKALLISSVTISKPSGVQLLKVTGEDSSAGTQMTGTTLLVRAV